MGENHCRAARKLWKEVLFCPTGGFQILQDVSSRTCIPFSNSATGQKTITRNGVFMPNCLWPVVFIYGPISTWPWDAHILLVSSEGNLPSSGQIQPLLVFPWLDPVDAPWGPISLQAFVTCSNILLGPYHPKTQVFHNLLSQVFYHFLLCSQLLSNILF